MTSLSWEEIAWRLAICFWPAWAGLVAILGLSWIFRDRLGLYGRLLTSPAGLIGLGLSIFWLLTAIFADQIAPHGALVQVSGMKHAPPGAFPPGADMPVSAAYLLGGDGLGRDVFSRMVFGARVVLAIAPAATLFAFMAGITLGLPAGYFRGTADTALSFLANLILAFPVILIFYLLVTPEIRETPIPLFMAATLFLLPGAFLTLLVCTRLRETPARLIPALAVALLVGGWIYAGFVFGADPFGILDLTPNLLNLFVAVVFVNAPTVFRIVRGLTMDLASRDYVAAAVTRGEGPWHIMLWEILPNARGPIAVDFCLRLGYTTILLGTLGFFGLGLSSESPDWGASINQARPLLSIYPHAALVPALALVSLVLGLNLLADGLRETSLKD